MKTCLHLILLAGLLLAGTTHAQSIDDNTEPVFLHARQQITSMLAADKQPSFEEAIYQLESAWYAGGIDYVSFKTNLDLHTQNIRTLINSINSPLSATSPDIAIPPQLAKTRNKNLIANYAIYTYLTQPTLWLYDSTLTIQQPVRYSAEDPMGTADWTNTHITHLLNNGTGNCFAMAALFKIFADRLGTDAQLCTAPGHIYIRHADENGTEYNVELAGRKFPGTGSIEAITYTTAEAVKNGIAMRQLDNRQAIALTLVYLAKARQYKTGRLDAYAATCAQTALQYDDKNLNAMLLKAEVMEEALLANAAEDIQQHPLFAEYQQWLQHIYSLGYRELPQHMKEKLVKGWGKKHIDEEPVPDEEEDTRYASLSWGLFDEQVKTEAVEQYGRTLFNTATQTIAGFATTSPAYNQYTYDPVIFAWEMDPMAHQMPGESPYSVLGNSPITFVDASGDRYANFHAITGMFMGFSDDNPWHNAMFGTRGRIVGSGMIPTSYFTFADPVNDVKALEERKIYRIHVLNVYDVIADLNSVDALNPSNKAAPIYITGIGYLDAPSLYKRYFGNDMYSKSKGAQDYDYSHGVIPDRYRKYGATYSPNDEKNPPSILFVVDGVAHNQSNYGNFLLGATGAHYSFTLSEIQIGAHINSLINSKQNGYSPQLDSRDDQFSILKGFNFYKDNIGNKGTKSSKAKRPWSLNPMSVNNR